MDRADLDHEDAKVTGGAKREATEHGPCFRTPGPAGYPSEVRIGNHARPVNGLRRVMILALASLVLAACGERRPPPPGPIVVVTVPVPQTRIVEVTREVPVTPLPSPTPAYSSPVTSPAKVLTYPLAAFPRTLDPQAAADAEDLLVVAQLYEPLFSLRGDGSIAPAAATGYQVSPDTRVYTVTLRSDLAWSDGQPLPASAFVAGFCRALEPAVGSPLAHLVAGAAPVSGAAAYASGEVADCGRVGVTAVNTSTLRISLDAPAAALPQLMTTGLFLPAPRSAGPITQTTILTGSEQDPVNGPFVLAERSGERLALTKNSRYWNAASVAVERVELVVVPERPDQLARYLEGGLQVAGFPQEERGRIGLIPALAGELQVLPQAGVSYLGFNTRRPPTDNVLVRRAIAHAIDVRRLLSGTLGQPWHVAANGLVPPGVAGHPGEVSPGTRYDPEAARRLLVEAGYDDANPVPAVELWYNREGNNAALFEGIAAMLEAVGIPVRTVASGWDVYDSGLNRCRTSQDDPACSYNLYRMGYVLDYPEASSLLRTLRPESGDQYTGWVAEAFDEALAAAAAEQDEALRAEHYRRAEAILLEEQRVIVPLIYYDRSLLVKRGIAFEFPAWGPPRFLFWRVRE